MARKKYTLDLHYGDWMKDHCVSACSPSTRGIWIDAICAMQDSDGFSLEGSLEQLSRILRASPAEVQSAVDELQVTGTADVTQRNGNVTLVNRRRKREYKSREQTRLRVMRHRGNADVTQKSRPLPITYISNTTPKPPPGPETRDEKAFEKFAEVWMAYPALRRGPENVAFDAWMRLNPDYETAKAIMRAIVALKESDWNRENGRFVPSFANWIDSRGWDGLVMPA